MYKNLHEIKDTNVFVSTNVFKNITSYDNVIFELFNGAQIINMWEDYVDINTGQVYTAICDGDNKIIGFID